MASNKNNYCFLQPNQGHAITIKVGPDLEAREKEQPMLSSFCKSVLTMLTHGGLPKRFLHISNGCHLHANTVEPLQSHTCDQTGQISATCTRDAHDRCIWMVYSTFELGSLNYIDTGNKRLAPQF